MVTDEGKIYGLIGTSLTHSFSMDFFNQKFISEGIDAQYFNFELNDIGELMTIFSEYSNLNGLNVTMPYKEKVIPFMDELDETAEKVGAVNVIKIIKGEKAGVIKLVGYNSDYMAFRNSIAPLLTHEMTSALVLGTGGASKAVKAALESLDIDVDLVSRRKSASIITYEELTKQRFITPQHLCYDLVYNPSETMFMKKAKERGAIVKSGLEMLLLQAFESYRIWTED